MMWKLCLAFFCVAVQASNVQARQLLQSKFASLITSESYESTGPRFQITVAFTECVEGVDASDFVIPGATAGTCQPGSGQLFSCSWNAPVGTHTITLPEGVVRSVSGNSVNDLAVFTLTVLGDFTPVLTTDPPTSNGADWLRREIVYLFLDDASKFVPTSAMYFAITGFDEAMLKVSSIEYYEDYWRITVVPPIVGQPYLVRAEMWQNSAINEVGLTNPTSNTVIVRVHASDNDCVVSEWSEWSACSEPQQCVRWTADFEPIYGSQTRTRTIIQAPGAGGQPCPPLTETSTACADDITVPCFDASRPWSGENTFDCKGCIEGEMPSGCFCGSGCEQSHDCCQSWYYYDCCYGQTGCFNDAALEPYVFPIRAFPLSCAPARDEIPMCSSPNIQQDLQYPSYFCYCDEMCLVDNMCCGGNDSRNEVCA